MGHFQGTITLFHLAEWKHTCSGRESAAYEQVVLHFQAPLLLGCDVRNMTDDTLEIVGNKEVIAVNQGD